MLRYYITRRQTATVDVFDAIESAAADGVEYIQIREKDLSARELAAFTRTAVDRTRRWPVRILVNSRVDVALAAGAHGVHLPAHSIAPEHWRTIVPRDFVIGVSCHTLEEVHRASDAHFVVFGPVFDTPGKVSPVGLPELKRVAASSPIPVFALGGVNASNAASCIAAGAAGIAAIRMFQGR